MARESIMLVVGKGPTAAVCGCSCGHKFFADSLEELNVWWDPTIGKLRCLCPCCSRLEDVNSFLTAIPANRLEAGTNRMKEYFYDG